MARLTPKGLIDCAQSMLPTGPGRPAEAALRRAISTAYYAVFCALGDAVAAPYTQPQSSTVRRLVLHGSAFEVLNRLTRPDPTTGAGLLRWHPQPPVCNSDLAEFGILFCELRSARELADYDHLWTVTKRDAVSAVGRARLAVKRLRSATRNAPTQVQAVCVAVIAGSNARQRLRH